MVCEHEEFIETAKKIKGDYLYVWVECEYCKIKGTLEIELNEVYKTYEGNIDWDVWEEAGK